MSHEMLERLLTPVGLKLTDQFIHRTMKGILFEATVASEEKETQVVLVIGTSISLDPIRVSGKSPNKVRQTVLALMQKHWVEVVRKSGNYGIVWNDDLKKFEKN